MRKKAAMEMSVGTIVTIVLLVSVLILGIFLIQRIRQSAVKVVDLTDEQLTNQVNKLFAEDKRIVIYPGTQLVEMTQEELGEVGIGIKNLLVGGTGTETFSYEVTASDASNCRETEEQVQSWIVVGSREEGIAIPSGSLATRRIRFNIPSGTSLCIARFRVNVFADDVAYGSELFDIQVEAQ
jgi:hypothetical protein